MTEDHNHIDTFDKEKKNKKDRQKTRTAYVTLSTMNNTSHRTLCRNVFRWIDMIVFTKKKSCTQIKLELIFFNYHFQLIIIKKLLYFTCKTMVYTVKKSGDTIKEQNP